jgi:Zn-dependent M28 family amino/carboxypeptidase
MRVNKILSEVGRLVIFLRVRGPGFPNKLSRCFALVIFLALYAAAQNDRGHRHEPANGHESETALAPELKEQLVALRDAALEDDYAYKQVAHLTENIGPRPSGSAQSVKAAQYVADEMRNLGLDVRLEEVKVPHWVRGTETAELVEYNGQTPSTIQRIVVTSLGGSTSTPADGLTADVVVVRNFNELAALGRNKVAGKIVLFNFPFDTRKADAGFALDAYGEAVIYRTSGAKAAAELGAVASLIRSVGGAEYRLPHTGFSVPAGIPAGALAAEDATLIADLAAQGKVRMHLTLTSQLLPETTGYNVVADLRGSEHPEQIVVVSGHLDSWDLGTGAIDDAAGVAVAMETAQLVVEHHYRPKRTLRVIAWVDEESGGRGRAAYTTAHGAEFANHVAAIESDLGAAHPLGFNAKVVAQAVEFLRPVLDVLQSIGANMTKTVDFSPGSDISAMAQAGVPTLGIMQDGRTYFNYHHSAADTLDKIEPRALQENAAAMVVMGYALACTDKPLPR